MLKGLLLGSVTGLVAAAGAQAADMPGTATRVQYVKICSLHGDGFYYIPGTDTCIKLGGYLRVQVEYNAGAGGTAAGSGSTEAAQARFARDVTNDFNHRTRAALSWDVRQETEYGTLRTYIRFGVQVTTPVDSQAGVGFWNRAFMQFAGFTVGRSQSLFDLFTYDGAYSYHTVTVGGDTSATGITLWAYTAQFGNGFSGTLSLEDPKGHNRAATVDASAAAFGVNAAVTGDTAFADQTATLNGFRVPDVIANLRVDQDWGFAGISGALHDASGAYYGAANNVANGHPADKLGWAVAVGGKLNLPGGDMVGANACYTEGSAGFCAGIGAGMQIYNASTSVGVGWLTDAVFDTGTEVELTRVWSAIAAYEHVWNPKWRTSWFGGYVNVSYTDAAKTIINAHMPGEGGTVVCAVPVTGTILPPITLPAGGGGNSCNPDFSFYEIGSRTQWNPAPQLDIGLRSPLFAPHQRVQGAGGLSGEHAAARDRLHRRPECLVRDVPLAAQLLSVIACSIVAIPRPPRPAAAGGLRLLRSSGRLLDANSITRRPAHRASSFSSLGANCGGPSI